MTRSPSFVHSTAEIEEGVHLGAGVRVWRFCHVCAGASIGPRSVLGQGCYVGPGVTLGENCHVQNNVSIYEGVTCEDDVFLGPSAVFTNVINPRSAISRRAEFRTTHVRKGATIGANATIVCGVEIGCYAFVGAGTVVTSDVAPFAIVVGNPGRAIGHMSRTGSRLRFDEHGAARCDETGERYALDDGRVTLIE